VAPRGAPRKVTDAAIIEALRAAGGVVSVAAQLLDVAPNTIRRQIRQNPVMRQAWDEIRDEALDLAEAKLLQAIRDGDLRAITFFLKTQGKHRGYGAKLEIGPAQPQGPDLSGMDSDKLDAAVDSLIRRTGGPILMPPVDGDA
jgi:hypothetical protein